MPPLLIIFGGLPGTGKTAIARELACRIGAVHLRIDSIEQAVRDFGLPNRSLYDIGYRVAYAVAEDNLRLGRTVIADSVNSIPLTRDGWTAVAARAQVPAIEVEVTCSDPNEHRRRVETRITDIPGLQLPAWENVLRREYHPWTREHLTIDTAGRGVDENVETICRILPGTR